MSGAASKLPAALLGFRASFCVRRLCVDRIRPKSAQGACRRDHEDGSERKPPRARNEVSRAGPNEMTCLALASFAVLPVQLTRDSFLPLNNPHRQNA